MCRRCQPTDGWIDAGAGAMSGEKFPATVNFSVVLQRRYGIDLCRPAGGDRAGQQGQRAESGGGRRIEDAERAERDPVVKQRAVAFLIDR